MVEAASRLEARMVRMVFCIFLDLPCAGARLARQKSSRRVSAFAPHITMRLADYYGPEHHEAASQFVGQRSFAAKYSAGEGLDGFPTMIDLPKPIPSAPNRAPSENADEATDNYNSPD